MVCWCIIYLQQGSKQNQKVEVVKMELKEIEKFMDKVYEESVKLNDVTLYEITKKHFEDKGYVFTFVDSHSAFRIAK